VIKILIIDDEIGAAQVLQLLIERHYVEKVDIKIATKINEAFHYIENFEPNIVFLDVMMPEMNGFELLHALKTIKFEIVFTTAFDEFAIRAIRFSALDYLLKPINAVELVGAFNRYHEKLQHHLSTELQLKNLITNLASKKESDVSLAIPTTAGAIFYSVAQIIRLEGEGNYTRFYIADNKKHVSAKTLKEYEEILVHHQFIRIHKSHMVNIKFIQSYLNEGAVVLTDGTELPISRHRKQEIAAMLKK
jgi:two-component system, LytTR family, response regulator